MMNERRLKDFRIVNQLHKVPMNIVGSYKIGKKIGEGGFAKVYKAHHLSTQDVLAVKVIDTERLSEYQKQKVGREIQIHSLLKHPNIARIYQIIQQSNKIYIFMQYIEGGELFDRIQSGGPISQPKAIKIFSQILSAVCYLHNNNITHRDIKTENIVLDSNMNAKLIDFGLAKKLTPELIRNETICGSPSYCAPEIIKKNREYDGKQVDVWCLGVTLFAMLEGSLPFDQDDPACLKSNIIHYKYQPKLSSCQAIEIYRKIFRQAKSRLEAFQLFDTQLLKKYNMQNPEIQKRNARTLSVVKKRKSVKSIQQSMNLRNNSLSRSIRIKTQKKKHDETEKLLKQKLPLLQSLTPQPHKKNNLFKDLSPIIIGKSRLRDNEPESPKRILDCVKGYK